MNEATNRVLELYSIIVMQAERHAVGFVIGVIKSLG